MHHLLRIARLTVVLIAVLCAAVAAGAQTADNLWDIRNGATVTAHSSVLPTSSINNMFGATEGTVEPTATLFSDANLAGFVHYVEWQTPAPIVLRGFRLYANHDFDANQRGFRTFNLYAADASGQFQLIYTFNPTNPYTFLNKTFALLINTFITPVTARRFRAEFVQYGDVNPYARGPRIAELEAIASPAALTLSGVTTSSITPTEAALSWMASLASSGTVEYGTTPALGSTLTDSTQTTAHSVNLTGLTPNTLYYYRVTATGAGQTATATGTFLTSQAGTPQLQIASNALTRSGAEIIANLTLSNIGTAQANSILITSAALGSTTLNDVPLSVAPVAAGTTGFPFGLHFNAAGLPSGTRTVLRLSGTYNGGSFSAAVRVTVP